MYTIPWFLNMFSTIFEYTDSIKIWDYIILNENFLLTFAVSLI